MYRAKKVRPEETGAALCIDLKILQDNWRKLDKRARKAACGAAVKADAYGIGVEQVTRALWQAGCRHFFVALPHEGIELRYIVPEAKIYVLSGVLPGQAELYGENSLIPVVASLQQMREWSQYCRQCHAKLATGIHLDTGINRLGFSEAELAILAKDKATLNSFKLDLVMSHLACGDDPANPMNEMQRQKFDHMRAMLPEAPASLANSPGTFLGDEFAYDIVRPGIALYGGNPFATRGNPMSPVVHLYAQVLQVRELNEGETVGYGATWKARKRSRVGVLGIGYRDGILRSLSWPANDGPAQVFIAGHFVPIIGRISMDLITIDLTEIPADKAVVGQKVEIMGDNITIDDMAKWAGTIPYEIITSLGSRYALVYSPLES